MKDFAERFAAFQEEKSVISAFIWDIFNRYCEDFGIDKDANEWSCQGRNLYFWDDAKWDANDSGMMRINLFFFEDYEAAAAEKRKSRNTQNTAE